MIHEKTFISKILGATLIRKGRGTLLVYMHAMPTTKPNVRFDPCACTADSIQWALAGWPFPSSGFIVDKAPRRTWGSAIADLLVVVWRPGGGTSAAPAAARRLPCKERPSLGSRLGTSYFSAMTTSTPFFVPFLPCSTSPQPPKSLSPLAAVESSENYKSLFAGLSLSHSTVDGSPPIKHRRLSTAKRAGTSLKP